MQRRHLRLNFKLHTRFDLISPQPNDATSSRSHVEYLFSVDSYMISNKIKDHRQDEVTILHIKSLQYGNSGNSEFCCHIQSMTRTAV